MAGKSIIVLTTTAAVITAALIACSPQTAAPTMTPVPPTAAQPVDATPTGEAATSEGNTPVSETPACTRLDLNETTEAALLATIPNFSDRMVREFLEYRPYVSIQQFRREIGKYVDEAQVVEYEQYVYVPVDPNNSDADTLMQLPGVDETLANSLIEGRPYNSNNAFLDALAESVTAEQRAEAECYLAATG